eukprot:10670616-Heterocapsa_arctica.AAC.1
MFRPRDHEQVVHVHHQCGRSLRMMPRAGLVDDLDPPQLLMAGTEVLVPYGLRLGMTVYSFPKPDHRVIVPRCCPVASEEARRPPRTGQPEPLTRLLAAVAIVRLERRLEVGRRRVSEG